MKVSIIIVNYHVKKELFACIDSIYASKPKASFEIIVVDNDEYKRIATDLRKRFPRIKYVANDNKGFGQGCNVGVKYAKGEYLFFLNPDTEVFPESIDTLVQFLQKKKDAGIVAPLLLGTDGKAYQQGTLTLTPQRGVFALSFLNKLFPNNLISKKYFLLDWDRKSTKEVEVTPGTAFVMKKSLFEKVGGFDEKFFLFFEEFDLCKRVREAGYKLFIYPKAQVKHAWGVSTRQRSDINIIFEKSRFYYFRKHFGAISALLTESIVRFNKYWALLIGIVGVGAFLRIHHIEQQMPFIGDQGWYYLSARDMVLTGDIPLVGIASSHPWLHQGALWTYMLAGSFWLSGFNPFVGGYLSIFLGILGVLGMYLLASTMFSRTVGLIAAVLFATSPLVIASDRMPYHTSPIPLVTIIFIYCLYKWVNGNVRFFPLVIFFLGILYNLEIATVLLGITTIVILLYCYIVKKDFARKVFSLKSLVLSLIAFVISMLPMLIYDVGHGFSQTLKVLAWMGYRVLVLFGYPVLHPAIQPSWQQMGVYSFEQLGQLVFAYNGWVALGLFVGSVVVVSHQVIKSSSHKLILILNAVLIVGFLAVRTASGAYLPMMFPGLILLVAVGGDWLIKKVGVVGVMVLITVMSFNSYFSFQKNSVDHSFRDRIEVAKYIVKEAGGKEYNLIGRGDASEFESFTMNYEYLAWWLGNGPVKEPRELQFVISEEKGIRVEKVRR